MTTPLSPARLAAIRSSATRGVPGPAGRALLDLLAEVERLSPKKAPCPLTKGESQVLLALAWGETCTDTARRTGRSAATVKSMRLRMYKRIDVRTGSQAVGKACAYGWISPADMLAGGNKR